VSDVATRSRIADPSLAAEGEQLIRWVARHSPVLNQLARDRLDDRPDAHRPLAEVRDALGLADVAVREPLLGDEADERAGVVEHRHQVHVLARHCQADVADRGVLRRGRKGLMHHVARAQVDVSQQHRCLGATACERPLGLRVRVSEPRGDVVVRGVESPLELGVADRGCDRVEIGIPVAGDVYLCQAELLAPARSVCRPARDADRRPARSPRRTAVAPGP